MNVALRKHGLGDYSTADPNTHPIGDRYSERTVFNGVPGGQTQAGQMRQDGLMQPPMVANINGWTLYTSTINASVQMVQYNPRRTAFVIQNQTDVNLFVNFGTAAGPTFGLRFLPGEGLIEDVEPCADSIFFYLSATPTSGVAVLVEGAYRV